MLLDFEDKLIILEKFNAKSQVDKSTKYVDMNLLKIKGNRGDRICNYILKWCINKSKRLVINIKINTPIIDIMKSL